MTVKLPPQNTQRWTAKRKVMLVEGIARGLIDRESACTRYGVGRAELENWITRYERLGLAGLLNKNIKYFRDERP